MRRFPESPVMLAEGTVAYKRINYISKEYSSAMRVGVFSGSICGGYDRQIQE